MTRIEEALDAIDTCSEVVELLEKQAADFVSGECISMLAGWIREELTQRAGVIRDVIEEKGRKVA